MVITALFVGIMILVFWYLLRQAQTRVAVAFTVAPLTSPVAWLLMTRDLTTTVTAIFAYPDFLLGSMDTVLPLNSSCMVRNRSCSVRGERPCFLIARLGNSGVSQWQNLAMVPVISRAATNMAAWPPRGGSSAWYWSGATCSKCKRIFAMSCGCSMLAMILSLPPQRAQAGQSNSAGPHSGVQPQRLLT